MERIAVSVGNPSSGSADTLVNLAARDSQNNGASKGQGVAGLGSVDAVNVALQR